MRAIACAAALVAITTLPACARNGDSAGADARAPAAPVVQQPPLPAAPADRPPLRRDTIQIEGSPQPVELRLVRSAAAFPIPFTTYVPAGFVVEAASGGDDAAVRFIAAFGGQRNDRAYMEIVVYPPGLTEAEALARAQRYGVEAGSGAEVIPDDGPHPPWTISRWRIYGRGADGLVLGGVSVGRHGARYFHVLTRYPAEYADGFGPRAQVILEEWRWDDGSQLRE